MYLIFYLFCSVFKVHFFQLISFQMLPLYHLLNALFQTPLRHKLELLNLSSMPSTLTVAIFWVTFSRLLSLYLLLSSLSMSCLEFILFIGFSFLFGSYSYLTILSFMLSLFHNFLLKIDVILLWVFKYIWSLWLPY